MLAAGVAIGFVAWMAAVIGGSAASQKEHGFARLMLGVSVALLVISYAMVTP
jgi:hypothetical protein